MTDLTATARPVALTSAEKPQTSRLWFVDNLRVALICLVVIHHIVVTYSGLPLWYYIEKPTSPAVGLGLTVFLLVDQAWFMGAFFLLSGYFTPSSYERKGTRPFLRDRLIRLGVPLVVFYFVLQPILLLPAYDGGSLAHWYLSAIGSGPLWFVLVLLVLDTVYALTVTHAFVVTAVGYALSAVPMPTLAKVAIAVVVALPACFALAGLVRWLPGMRRVL